MSFRYINPGYVSLLDNKDSTTQLTNTTLSKTGVAFIKNSYDYAGVIAPAFISGNDFWIKFDFYMLANNSSKYYTFTFYLPNTKGIYICISISDNRLNAYVYGDKYYYFLQSVTFNDSVKKLDCGLIQGAINSVLIHAVYGDSTTAYVDLSFNGNLQTRQNGFAINSNASGYTRNVNAQIGIFANNVNAPISNIIFSDSEISYKETVIKLPISSTESDMTFDSETGIYTATAINQSLLSAVNVNALADEYGSDSQVTGIALVGNPAYKTAEGLSSLTAFSKDISEKVIEYGTYALGSDSSGVIADSQIFSDTKIADLQNLKFGWITK